MTEVSWYFLAIAVIFGLGFIGMGVDSYSKNMANAEIAKVCIEQGKTWVNNNCEESND